MCLEEGEIELWMCVGCGGSGVPNFCQLTSLKQHEELEYSTQNMRDRETERERKWSERPKAIKKVHF